MNSPLPVSCDTTILAGNGGFNRRRLPSAPASTPTERRGYNFSSSRIVATSLCRGAEGPSGSPSTPTERRGYNFSSSRIVATSLCRGAEGPSGSTSTPSPLSRARLHAVTSNVSLGSSEPSAPASTPISRRRMNSPLPVSCDTTILAGNGGFNRRRLPSASPSTPTERRDYNFSSSRIVATSLCRGAEGPSAPASTPSPLSRARLHAVTSNVSLGSSEPSAFQSN
jgi:hypothetical protein